MKESRSSRRQHNVPTIKDVAAHAGVSPMTVSRVINDKGGIRPGTRDRVEAAIAALNYAPNTAARMLAGGEDMRIGVLHTNPSFFYFSEFLVGCLDQASRQAVQIVIEKCEPGTEIAAIEHLTRGRIDGVILPPPLCDSALMLDALHERGIPVMAISTGRAPGWALSVSIDDRHAAYDMTRHLGDLGHRRIGFITGAPNQTASADRLEGYRAALVDLGLPASEALIADGLFTYRSGLDATERLLDLPEPPSAIFAANDDMAAAAIAVAHRRDLDVPRDLTVVGFDDSALAATIWPELTTIRQPVTDMARRAVELLVEALRLDKSATCGSIAEPHVQIGYALIRRQSDAPPRSC